MAKYISPMSVEYRKPIVLDYNDPKANPANIELFRSKAGADVIVRDFSSELMELDDYVETSFWLSELSTDRAIIASTTDGTNLFFVLQDYGSGLTVIKYDSVGEIAWQKQISATNYLNPFNINLDSSGNIYVCGYLSATYDFAFLIKLTSAGAIDWAKTISSSGKNLGTYAIDLDSFDNLYINVTGNAASSSSIIKIDSSGTVIWSNNYLIAEATDTVTISSIKVLSSGDIVVGGYYNVNSEGYYRFVHKIDSSGTVIWSKKISTFSTNVISYSQLAIDSSDNIVISFPTPSGTAAILKLNSSGSIVYDYEAYANTDNSFSLGGSVNISIDSSNNIYLFSESYGPIEYGNPDMAIIKINSSGSSILQKIYGTLGNNYYFGIAPTSSSTLFLTEKSEVYDEGTSSYIYTNIISNLPNDFNNVSGNYTIGSTIVHFATISPAIALTSLGASLSSLTTTSSSVSYSYNSSPSFSSVNDTLTHTTGTF